MRAVVPIDVPDHASIVFSIHFNYQAWSFFLVCGENGIDQFTRLCARVIPDWLGSR